MINEWTYQPNYGYLTIIRFFPTYLLKHKANPKIYIFIRYLIIRQGTHILVLRADKYCNNQYGKQEYEK